MCGWCAKIFPLEWIGKLVGPKAGRAVAVSARPRANPSKRMQAGVGVRSSDSWGLRSHLHSSPIHTLPRTGGTLPPSPTTTAPGTWWSMTGCTATCIKTGCGYEPCTLLSSHGPSEGASSGALSSSYCAPNTNIVQIKGQTDIWGLLASHPGLLSEFQTHETLSQKNNKRHPSNNIVLWPAHSHTCALVHKT